MQGGETPENSQGFACCARARDANSLSNGLAENVGAQLPRRAATSPEGEVTNDTHRAIRLLTSDAKENESLVEGRPKLRHSPNSTDIGRLRSDFLCPNWLLCFGSSDPLGEYGVTIQLNDRISDGGTSTLRLDVCTGNLRPSHQNSGKSEISKPHSSRDRGKGERCTLPGPSPTCP